MNYNQEPDAYLIAKKRQYIKKKKQLKTIIIVSICIAIVAVWVLIGFTISKLYKTYVPDETTAEAEEKEPVKKPVETQVLPQTDGASFYEGASLVPLELTKEQVYSGSLIRITEDEDGAYRATNANIVPMNYAGKPFKLPDGSIKCEKEAFDAAKEMFEAFFDANNNGNFHIKRAHLTEKSTKCTAEHLSGYAFDINIYTGTPTAISDAGEPYNWIYDNCAKYGFVLRYPDNTEHFRYVGKGHSMYMSENGISLEEYLGEFQKYVYGEKHLIFTYDNVKYESFYVYFDGETESVSIDLPEGVPYSVSGDNICGVIVTLYK